VYPVLTTTTTDDLKTTMPGWTPSQKEFFTYTVVSTATAAADGTFYTLTATGTGGMSGCNLTLKSDNTRTMTSGSSCGGATW
jgi:type IV pilus assembly protein PilE